MRPSVFAVCQDPEIARWVTIPQPFPPADADAFIENALAMWRDGTGAPFAIVDAATDRLLGAVTRFGPEGHQATFGLWLAPDARGRGVGTRALRLVADWTFATTAAIRLDAFIMVGNEASNRMVERAGFQREGVLRREPGASTAAMPFAMRGRGRGRLWTVVRPSPIRGGESLTSGRGAPVQCPRA